MYELVGSVLRVARRGDVERECGLVMKSGKQVMGIVSGFVQKLSGKTVTTKKSTLRVECFVHVVVVRSYAAHRRWFVASTTTLLRLWPAEIKMRKENELSGKEGNCAHY